MIVASNILRARILITLSLVSLIIWHCSSEAPQLYCRDPDLGGHVPASLKAQRKFLLIGGAGAGLGNFLIFFPAAYYFAALTGRDILIIDNSLIGEMCSILTCGFPKYSEIAAAFPAILNEDKLSHLQGAKVYDFHRHIGGEALLDNVIVRADGYKFMSGWYLGRNKTEECVVKLTGCGNEDVGCHDRHALQRLIRGPFKTLLSAQEEQRVIGVPQNLKHAILTLPHAYAPRLDAAIHLRCQFQHFEYLVGPEDASWPNAVKELHDWVNSSAHNAGKQIFKLIEERIVQELPNIRGKAAEVREQRKRLLISAEQQLRRLSAGSDHLHIKSHISNNKNNKHSHSQSRQLQTNPNHDNNDNNIINMKSNNTALSHVQHSLDIEQTLYEGTDTDKIYVYLASDNEVVKELFAEYLMGHQNIAVMRTKNNAQIVHAKNIDYLRGAGNNTGVMDLVLDWYSLSLANVVFAWRRDTDILSTFAHSAQRVSGNTELSDNSAGIGHGIGSRGLQLYFNKRGQATWRLYSS